MRLWSIHPKYLDVKGLTACWREGLLAQNVLLNKTKGYKNHPQLNRFKSTSDPVYHLSSYLYTIYEEARKRGYRYDSSKIYYQRIPRLLGSITVTRGQLEYEFNHLKTKLEKRNYNKLVEIKDIIIPDENPIFKPIDGTVENWDALFRY